MSEASSGDREQRFNDIVAAHLEAVEAGERRDWKQLQERHPDLATEIAEFFREQAALSSQVAPLRSLVEHTTDSAAFRTGAGLLPETVEVGDYRLLREIGRGGMGIVYEAQQRSLGRRVALKVLPWTATLDRQQLPRFHNEAQAAAGLHHTHIVPIFEVGCAGNVHYYAMQLIEGQSLAVLLDQRRCHGGLAGSAAGETSSAMASYARPVPGGGSAGARVTPSARFEENGARPAAGHEAGRGLAGLEASAYFRQVATLGVQAAEALDHAHQRGVLHRDIKPANVLLDAHQHVWITDFGLAKAGGSSELTRTGDVVGTLRYLAPERFSGQSEARGDVYSLGLTLYEMLTLQPAFAETHQDALIQQVLRAAPARPRQIEPRIPRDLETIVLKAIAKEPGRRYATALELAEDLRRFLADRPIYARRITSGERTWRWCRRNPLVASLIALAAGLLLAGTVVSSFFAVRANRKAAEAEANARQTREEKQRSDHRLYMAQINLAHQDWKEGNTGLVSKRLKDLAPKQDDDPDFRGFEWHYLQRLGRLDLRTLDGHTAAVASVAFSPDGRRIASAGADQTIRLWDTATGQETAVLRGHTNKVRAVAFSPDGLRLASASEDQLLKVWDVATGGEVASLRGHTDQVWGVAFSPDGQQLASASGDRTVKLWDAATGKEVATYRGHERWVACVAFSPDGRRLASGACDRTAKVWDLTTGQETFTLRGHTGNNVWCVAFNPDGKLLASAGWDQTVKVWDMATGRELRTLRGHSNAVVGVAFSRDGRRLASASWDNTLKVWDVDTWRERLTLRGHLRLAESVAFSPDGRLLASAGDDQTVKIWDATTDHETLTLRGHTGGQTSGVAFSPDGRLLASGGADHLVKLWETATGNEVRTLHGHTAAVGQVEFSPDGRRLASASADHTAKVWDPATGQEIFTLRGHTDCVRDVAFSPDGRLLASGATDKLVKVWDMATGQELRTLTGHTQWVAGVAFSPDGRLLASASHDMTVKLWEMATGQEVFTLRGHKMYVESVAFSPDGRRLASAGWDRSAKVWDVAAGQVIHTLSGHTSNVYGVAFSPDGGRIVSCSDDHTVKVWDAATGHLLLSLRGHGAGVARVVFSPDGRRLASTSWDQTVRIWDATDLTPETLLQREARGVVQFLSAQSLPKDEVVARIRGDATLSEPVRQRALALVGP